MSQDDLGNETQTDETGTAVSDDPVIAALEASGADEELIADARSRVPKADFTRMRQQDSEQVRHAIGQNQDMVRSVISQLSAKAQGGDQDKSELETVLSELASQEGGEQQAAGLRKILGAQSNDLSKRFEQKLESVKAENNQLKLNQAVTEEVARVSKLYPNMDKSVWESLAVETKAYITAGIRITPEQLLFQKHRDAVVASLTKGNEKKKDEPVHKSMEGFADTRAKSPAKGKHDREVKPGRKETMGARTARISLAAAKKAGIALAGD